MTGGGRETRRTKKRKPPLSGNGRGATCAYCRRKLEATGSHSKLAATRDHVHPKSLGGYGQVWCCRQCNQLKGCMTMREWLRFMGRNPEWWNKPQFQQGTVCHTKTLAQAADEWAKSTDPRILITADHRRRPTPTIEPIETEHDLD